MTIAAKLTAGMAIAPFGLPEVRVLTKRYGGLLGPVFTVACGDQYFEVGELTLQQLKRGTDPTDLDLLEIDPDAEQEQY